MKRFYYLLLLVASASYGQIYFPDPALKAALMAPNYASDWNFMNIDNIDTNGDGEIDFDEASQVVELDISNKGISDLTGIEAFVNLEQLMAAHNQIESCQLQGMPALRYLDVGNNGMTILDVSFLEALENITFAQNPLISIDISNCLQISSVTYSGAELMDFRANNCPNLNSLAFSAPNLTFLDFEGSAVNALSVWGSLLTSLSLVDIPTLGGVTLQSNLQLTDIVVSNCPNLFSLNVLSSTQLQSISVSGAPSLEIFSLFENQVSSLDVSQLSSLIHFNCMSTQVSSLDVSMLTNLTNLTVTENLLTELDVSALTSLTSLNCRGNQLTTLDVSNLTQLAELLVDDNQLETLFMKNGRNEFMSLDGNPDLSFICADDAQIPNVMNLLNTAGVNAVVNSYCSFVPGGDYNTITGTVRFDADSNGCSASDPVHPFIKVSIDNGSDQGATFTSDGGTYAFYTEAGNFEVIPQLEIPSYFNVISTATVNFPTVDNSVVTQDFCIVPNGVHRDLEVVIAPIVPARPGFPATYKVVLRNKGNQTMSMPLGLDFYYDSALMTFTSSSVAPDSSGVGQLEWNYANLQPFESRSIEVTMQINAPTHPTNPVGIDDQLNFAAVVETVGGDDMPADNAFEFQQIVVGSYDPNNIICVEGNVVSPVNIGQYLHYITNFENTGTDYAENVVVRINFNPSEFDVDSMQLMDSSDPVYARITGNQVEYIFENIMLEIGGHGNILLKVKTQNNLTAGDVVINSADIFFDYNHPVITDPAQTLFQSLKTPGFASDASVVVYPNPSSGIVNINANSTIERIELFDVYGRLLQMKVGELNDATLDVSSRAKGVYYLRIKTASGISVQKLLRD